MILVVWGFVASSKLQRPQIKGIGICNGQFPAGRPRFLAVSLRVNVTTVQLILRVDAKRESPSESVVVSSHEKRRKAGHDEG